jgi:predicted ABC-type transport system involved in lysophospholipase L1 biosynthesis ATPase subunit
MTLILVTHDMGLAHQLPRCIRMTDGRVAHDTAHTSAHAVAHG